MKNVKVLASIAALATVSCMAAVSASAASSIKFELDAAKSNATTKVVNVNFVSDEINNVSTAGFIVEVDGTVDGFTSKWCTPSFEYYEGNQYILTCASDKPGSLVDGVLTLGTMTVTADELNASSLYEQGIDFVGSGQGTEVVPENSSFAVVNATDLGTFTDGEGVAVKAFTAKAAVDGKYTWNVTDGTNAAKSASIDVTGGADVVIGLTVAGANAGNVSYAAVTID